MKRQTRYFFIGLGALFFLVAAPLMIFYVGGIRYDFHDNEYNKTGILSIVTDPKKAEVSLDGQRKDPTPTDLRFLSPKEYTVTVTKDGYWDWSKRLEVKAGKATIASGALDKIYLLRKTQDSQFIADGVLDYTLDGSQLVYLTASDVNLVKDNNLTAKKSLSVTGQPESLKASPNASHILVLGKQSFVLNVGAWRLTNVTAEVANAQDLQITDNGQLLILNGGKLTSFEPNSKKTTALLSGIQAFTVLGQNLYFIQNNDQTTLGVVPLPDAATAKPQVLLNTLPANLKFSRLMVTEQKDLIVLANDNLYKVNQGLDPIAEDIQELYFDSAKSLLLYATASELSWYEFTTNRSNLITRNTQTITSPQLDPQIGYAFYMQNNQVQAMELDDHDHQNNYQLLPVAAGQSIRLGPDHRTLFVLDGQKLLLLSIR